MVVGWNAPKGHWMVLNVSVAVFEQNAGAVEALSQDAPGIFSPESCMRTAN